MLTKLKESDSNISRNLFQNIEKRIKERKNSDLIGLIRCLKDAKIVPLKEHLSLVSELMKRTFSVDVKEESREGVENTALNRPEPIISISMENELENILKVSVVKVRNE